MATIVNDRDLALQATSPRLVDVTLPSNIFIPAVKGLDLSAPSSTFQVSTAGVASPASVLLTATLKQIYGAVAFSVTAGTATLTGSGNTRTLTYANAATDSVTVTASISEAGVTYTRDFTVAKVRDGANGTRTATLEMYRWALSAPTTYPTGSSTYTWATGAFTAPATPNGWTLLPGPAVAGQTLWGITQLGIDTLTSTSTTMAWASSTVYALGAAGTDGLPGASGTRTAVLDLYQWSASSPATFPVGLSTYTWATGQFTVPGTLNGWTAVPGAAVAGQTLYIARQVFADTATTASSIVTWSVASSRVLGSAGTNGGTGANGQSVGFLEVYQWAATAPALPTGSSTYTWATGAFTAPTAPGSWSLTPGASIPGQTLWATSVSVSDALTSATSIATWTGGTVYAVGAAGTNGANGQRVGVLEVYQWAASAPTTYPSGTSTFIWATGAYGAPTTPAGWSLVPGAPVAGQILWGISVRVSDTLLTTTSTATWNSTTVYALGAAGSTGVRGTRTLYLTNASYVSAYGAAAFAAAATAAIASATAGTTPTTPLIGDTVCFTNGTTYAITYVCTVAGASPSWAPPGMVIDGNLLVTGTVGANKVDARGLSILDGAGNVILSAGSSIQSQINPYQSGATKGADWATNVTGASGVNSTIQNTVARLTTRTNLVYNSSFENGFADWIGSTSSLAATDGLWGRCATGNNITGTGAIAQDRAFNAQPGEWYTVTGDSLMLNATAGSVYFDIEWLTSTRAIIGDSGEGTISTNHDFSSGETNRLAHAVNVQAPGNAVFGRVRFVWQGIAGSSVIVGCRQIKVERGILPATPYTAEATLPVLQANAAAAQTSANTANATLANIADDNVLTRGEKPVVMLEFSTISAEYPGIQAQAGNLSISVTEYNSSISSLQAYMASISPAYTDVSQDSPITGSTFRQKFVDYYYQKQVVLNAIAAKAATLSSWGGVSGAGKPADNATVGATFGSNISGQITAATASTYIASVAIGDAQIGTLDAQKINTGYLSADRIQAGAIDASKLNVGIGGNLLNNSTFAHGMSQWYTEDHPGTSITVTADMGGYFPRGGHAISLNQPNNWYNGDAQYYQGVYSAEVPCVAGQRYEWSAYVGNHRATEVHAFIGFMNAAGAALAYSASEYCYEGQGYGGTSITDYKRVGGFITAPAGTSTVRMWVRKSTTMTGQANSWLMLTQTMIAPASPNQTILSPWTLGGAGTKITGSGIETNSVTATNIDSRGLSIKDASGNVILSSGATIQSQIAPYASGATVGATFGSNISGQITTDNISTYIAGAAIGTAQIGTAAITSAKIGALEVNTANIAGNAVTVSNSAGGASTASTSVYVPTGQVMKILCICYSGPITINANDPAYAGVSGTFNGTAFSSLSFTSQTTGAGNVHTNDSTTWMGHASVAGPATVSATANGSNVTVALLGTMR